MHIHLRRVASGGGEGDLVALLHQGANRNRQVVEVVAGAGINLAIFQWQTATARDQYQDFSFYCHFVLLSEIGTKTGDRRGVPFIETGGLASTVCEISALSDLDNVTVRIADVAANLTVLGYRLRDELGSSTFP